VKQQRGFAKSLAFWEHSKQYGGYTSLSPPIIVLPQPLLGVVKSINAISFALNISSFVFEQIKSKMQQTVCVMKYVT